MRASIWPLPVLLWALCPVITTVAVASDGYSLYAGDTLDVRAGVALALQANYRERVQDNEASVRSDELEFTRLRPYIEVEMAKDWQVKLAWELGGDNHAVKDAYLRYAGIDWLDITLGNEVVPFSRERMTSFRSLQSPERTLTADSEFGVPGRQLGVHLTGDFPWPLQFYFSYARADVHGDLLTEIQFISPLDRRDVDSSARDKGLMTVARIDYSLGAGAKYRQGDFKKKFGLTLSAAAFDWKNDEDVVEIEQVQGQEIALAVRGFGWSIDLQRQQIDAESPYQLLRPLFVAGNAGLEQDSIKAGYLFSDWQFEIFAAAADMRADAWTRTWHSREFGGSYFMSGHEHKVQLSYRIQDDIKAKDLQHKELMVQWLYSY